MTTQALAGEATAAHITCGQMQGIKNEKWTVATADCHQFIGNTLPTPPQAGQPVNAPSLWLPRSCAQAAPPKTRQAISKALFKALDETFQIHSKSFFTLPPVRLILLRDSSQMERNTRCDSFLEMGL